MERSDEKPITGMFWPRAARPAPCDAFAQHRADNDVGAVTHERARRRLRGSLIRAGIARDQERVLVAMIEKREFGRIVERGRILGPQRERQQ